MPMRRISERLVRQRLEAPEKLEETVVVDGKWYWKSRGVCWTQPTDKSEPRKEISEEEYRDICAKSKNGVTEISKKDTSVDRKSFTKTRTDKKLETFSSSLKKESEIKSFNSMMDSADEGIKQIFAKYASKSQWDSGKSYQFMDGQKYEYGDSDAFYFFIPNSSYTAINKDLYNTFGSSGKSVHGGTGHRYTVASKDSTGDFEIELNRDDGGCAIEIKKYY